MSDAAAGKESSRSDAADSQAALYEAYQRQQQDIENEINESQSFITVAIPTGCLLKEYSDDAVFLEKCRQLCSRYPRIRRIRGDGNCFYRGFGFAYLDQLRGNSKEVGRLRELCRVRKDAIIELGYSSITVDDFYDTFCEILDAVGNGCSVEELEETFNNQGQSDYVVVFLRLLVSGHLQRNAEFFQNFLDRDISIRDFCTSEVEPMKYESDHIHIIALTQTLEACIAVEYMHRDGESINRHVFPDDGSCPSLTLLYRPGHYDIIYDS